MIADCGGFTRAGERLHKTQSTVSQQVKRLEARLQLPLFRRDRRGVRLTEHGEVLLGHARRVLEANDAAALSPTRVASPLRFGVAQDFRDARLTTVLARFARTHPAVCMAVRVDATTRLRQAAADGELDLALLPQECGGCRR